MAEPLIVINGCIDQLSSALPHVTKPAGFQKVPCQKVLYSHGWEQNAKAELCSPFFLKAHWWGAEQWTGAKLGIFSLQSILFWFASSFKVQQFKHPARPRSHFLHFKFRAKKHHKVPSPRGNQSQIPPGSSPGCGENQPSYCWSLCWVLAPNICTALEVAQFAAWKISSEKDAHNLNDTEYSIMEMTQILEALWWVFLGELRLSLTFAYSLLCLRIINTSIISYKCHLLILSQGQLVIWEEHGHINIS